jgi:hypothetical protein
VAQAKLRYATKRSRRSRSLLQEAQCLVRRLTICGGKVSEAPFPGLVLRRGSRFQFSLVARVCYLGALSAGFVLEVSCHSIVKKRNLAWAKRAVILHIQ